MKSGRIAVLAHITNHMPTSELQALDAAHHLHPFTNGNELKNTGVRVVTRADGVMLTDSDGNTYLDAMAGLWCVNLGYGRSELADAAARQMRELPYSNTFFQTSHVPAISLANRLAELAPHDLNNVFYAGSGSEANDTNIRLVRTYWAEAGKPEKKIIISRHNAYHGSAMGSGSLGGMSYMHAQGGLPIDNIHHIDQPYWYGEGGDVGPDEFGLERARQLERKILEFGQDRVAAFIAEPIQGAGGVIIPPKTYWPEIQRICNQYNVLLIADEVITGFGRTGRWFGSETLDIKPDVMTIAKGLTSGYAPLGASLVNDRIAEVLNGCEFAHGYTYCGHPVCCAVALENLRILDEEKIIERAGRIMAPYLKEKWESLAEHPLVGEATIIGHMGSIALSPDKQNRARFANDEEAGTICRKKCYENGLIMRPVHGRMVISPPLIITEDEIDQLAERAWKALDQTRSQIHDEGLMKSVH
ncbi:MAG: aspartate aminotransferase family protein [Roseovarius sp.]|nr:aspartate aminotransferase family protein [Roseovarius sp.]MCY4291199.1 aspartate aminotransferase family protein [Roseovarius sp.]MCY4315263.1 aspartate aminotransferase family protein [Roseovarius sp.]